MKVAIYARVSTNDQTVENQVRELREVADKMGAAEIKVFTDQGISGAKGRDKRPALDEMLKAVTRREIDKVMIWSVDRMGRSTSDLVLILDEINQSGTDLYIHRNGIDTSTASGKAMFGMLGVFAEFERDMISVRVKAGLERAKANGVKLGRRPTSQIVAKQICERRERGESVRKIAKALDVSIATVSRVANAA
jgi:DNA invertase Pin-like site-specific DNA recombinase